jgi:PTH1 family peptidyl-tRNA hydrolase
MSETKLVVGLGNPGREYAATRHNVGFRVIDLLAEALSIDVKKRKFGAMFAKGELADKRLILLKPWEFMNRSGRSVAKAVGFYELEFTDLLVIIDDMALAPGRIRIRAKGSSGGHKGLAGVLEKLGTDEVGRVRVGIGKCCDQNDVDFVLDRPREEEKGLLEEAMIRARDAVMCWVEYGIEATMNEFNG